MSIHVCECDHNGRKEYHLRYPGMSKQAAQELADKINSGKLDEPFKCLRCVTPTKCAAWGCSPGTFPNEKEPK